MQIGTLAKKTNLSVDTIRYYTKEGLLTYTKQSGKWDYDEQQIELLTYIALLKSMHFSLKEIYYVIHIDEVILEDFVIDQEKVNDYKQFFSEKMMDINEQEKKIKFAKKKLTKLMGKLDQLSEMETFEQ